MFKYSHASLLGTVAALILSASALAAAADAPVKEGAAASVIEDVVVTARRRDETSMQVPVTIAAIGADEIERRGLNTLDAVSRAIPQLLIGESTGVQGGAVSIRGVASGDNNPFVDQAVSFNVDGAQVARASVRRMAQLDIAGIEVLMGPQALFFGKNSPGGIVVIHTADPTPAFESRVSLGYEPYSEETRGEGFVSLPLTENIGGRLALYGSTMKGEVHNVAAPSAAFGPSRATEPHQDEYAGRLTLKFEPGNGFDARFKTTFGKVENGGFNQSAQLIDCPTGSPQLGGVNECSLNDRKVRADPGPVLAGYNPGFRDGQAYLEQKQWLSSLDLNYRPGDTLKLTSISSYYSTELSFGDNFNEVDTVSVNSMLAAHNAFDVKEWSQELRLSSEFDGPLQFMIGGYAQWSKLNFFALALRNAAAPAIVTNFQGARQSGDAYSAFGQVSYEILPQLELSGGGRYSYEKKEFSASAAGVALQTAVPDEDWDNFSPEATLTWKPSTKLTVFGSYKRGFLSGGFNAGTGDLRLDRTFDEQTIRGFEVGAKSILLDGTLRADISAYDYDVLGLQVSSVQVATTGTIGAINTIVTNAGKSGTKGVELSANWSTPLTGLRLQGALAYNKSRYDIFQAPCYAGQTQQLGCDQQIISGIGRAQDLVGQPSVRSPDWSAALGSTYEMSLGDFDLSASVDSNYSDGYFTDVTNKPASWQSSYWLFDTTLRARNTRGGYEIAIVGRNLGGKLVYARTQDTFFTGTGTGTAGTGTLADTTAFVGRGREVLLRFSVDIGRVVNR